MCLAVPGKIDYFVADDPEAMKMAKVDFGGIKKIINLDLVPEADVGDFVLRVNKRMINYKLERITKLCV